MARIPPSSYFRKVMSFPTQKPPEKAKQKAPKGAGGGGAKAKGIKSSGRGKTRLILKTVFEADAGGESSYHPDAFFTKNLKYLSKNELRRLMRKIKAILNRQWETTKEVAIFDDLFGQTKETITKYLLHSEAIRTRLKSRIYDQLKQWHPFRIKKNGKNGYTLTKRGEEMPLEIFIKEHFTPIIERYNRYVDKGEIIVDTHQERGLHFVKKTILEYCFE